MPNWPCHIEFYVLCFFSFFFVSSENPNYISQNACWDPPTGGPGRMPNWPCHIQFYVFCFFVFIFVSSENPNYIFKNACWNPPKGGPGRRPNWRTNIQFSVFCTRPKRSQHRLPARRRFPL